MENVTGIRRSEATGWPFCVAGRNVQPRAADTAEFTRILADSNTMWGNVARNIGFDAK